MGRWFLDYTVKVNGFSPSSLFVTCGSIILSDGVGSFTVGMGSGDISMPLDCMVSREREYFSGDLQPHHIIVDSVGVLFDPSTNLRAFLNIDPFIPDSSDFCSDVKFYGHKIIGEKTLIISRDNVLNSHFSVESRDDSYFRIYQRVACIGLGSLVYRPEKSENPEYLIPGKLPRFFFNLAYRCEVLSNCDDFDNFRRGHDDAISLISKICQMNKSLSVEEQS